MCSFIGLCKGHSALPRQQICSSAGCEAYAHPDCQRIAEAKAGLSMALSYPCCVQHLPAAAANKAGGQRRMKPKANSKVGNRLGVMLRRCWCCDIQR